MELSFLYSIPRTDFLDKFFLFFTKLPGSIGQLWLIVGIALCISKKTRKTGAAVLVCALAFCAFSVCTETPENSAKAIQIPNMIFFISFIYLRLQK